MPATHHIDNDNKLIVTTWDGGEPSAQELSFAFKVYLREIKNNPDLFNFNELVDFRKIEASMLTTEGLVNLAITASKADKSDANSKLAIVVSSTLAYGLARIYEICRSLNSNNKELRVFKDKSSALDWLTANKD